MPKFAPEEFLRLVERYRITTTFMVPTMFVRLLRLPDEVKKRYDLSSLVRITHAGAPCAPEIKRAMIEWLGPVLNEYYGATELGALTHCSSQEWLTRPGTVGRITPGAEILILDDSGNPLPDGQPGEVYARATFQAPFTYHNRDSERDDVVKNGFVTAGDVGYFDADGFLFLCDRKRDMIISAGVNIYPAEIEAALLSVPGVQDCGVFGIPDPEFGEVVCAAVIVSVGTTEEHIRAGLKRDLANFKIPRKIEFHATLPRDDSGKLLKRLLREPHWHGAQRQI
jgi:long-chain acyl-CoA synthetase